MPPGYRLCALIGLLAFSTRALGGVGAYFEDYQPGISYGASTSATVLTYDAPYDAAPATGCTVNTTHAVPTNHCETVLNDASKWNLGFFLQQPFRRQGWFYHDVDLGFNSYVMDGELAPVKPNADGTLPKAQPLTEARVHLYGANAKGYLTLGVTPPSILPDILVSVGLGADALYGNVEIEHQRENVLVSGTLVFMAAEIVWLRFSKTGAVSSSFSYDVGGVTRDLYHQQIAGMTNFKLQPTLTTWNLIRLAFPAF